MSSSGKFWDKVDECEHKNISDSFVGGVACPTPYCEAEEIHCLDCGVYIERCGCGYLNGMSGWPERRWKKIDRKRKGAREAN